MLSCKAVASSFVRGVKSMEYARPENVVEAVSLGRIQGASFLAGGTDLVLQMRNGMIRPRLLVDLGRLDELAQITESDGWLEVGSMTTFAQLGGADLVKRHATALYQAGRVMGSPQIRHQATIGGNLGHCSPGADGLPPLLALGCWVRLQSPDGKEVLPLGELLQRRTLLAPGTLIRGFSIPLPGSGPMAGYGTERRSGFAKVGKRRALAIADVSVAVAVSMAGGYVREAWVALGAAGERPHLNYGLADKLRGRRMDAAWLEMAVTGAKKAVADELGTHPLAPYKREAVGGAMREALKYITTSDGR